MTTKDEKKVDRRRYVRDRLARAVLDRLIPDKLPPELRDVMYQEDPRARSRGLDGWHWARYAAFSALRRMPTWWQLAVALLAFALPAKPRRETWEEAPESVLQGKSRQRARNGYVLVDGDSGRYYAGWLSEDFGGGPTMVSTPEGAKRFTSVQSAWREKERHRPRLDSLVLQPAPAWRGGAPDDAPPRAAKERR